MKNIAELLECDEGEIRVCYIDKTTKVSDKNCNIIEIEDKIRYSATSEWSYWGYERIR